MIDLNREEFEKLPEIEKHLVFIDGFYDNKYHSMNNSSVTDFINGAWYAFQEQQKKLDCCREENKAHLEKIDELQARVNGALKELELITCYRTGNSDNAIDILKGNKDEN